MIQVPLYSRGRPLKNLIADWKKQTGNNTILVNKDFDWTFTTPPTDGVQPDNDFYERAVNYWYFSEIGFDTDEIFIKRFNDIYYDNIDRFTYLLKSTNENGYSWDKTTRIEKLMRKGTDTDSETGNKTVKTTNSGTDSNARVINTNEKHTGEDTTAYGKTVNTSKTGEDEFIKGTTTTSDQKTSNLGNKLTRNTPNENLNVSGTNRTTVSDEGSDITKYGSTTTDTNGGSDSVTYNTQKSNTGNVTDTITHGGVIDVLETPNITKSKQYNSNFDNDVTETREKLTLDEYEALQRIQSIYKQFALLFENLFMEVLNYDNL